MSTLDSVHRHAPRRGVGPWGGVGPSGGAGAWGRTFLLFATLALLGGCSSTDPIDVASSATDTADHAATGSAPTAPTSAGTAALPTAMASAPASASENGAGAVAPAPAVSPSAGFATTTVTLTDGTREVPVDVWVADSPELRSRGLMGRTELPAGTGMVFTYTDDRTGQFWMQDTRVPLSIAWADADGVIHTMADMEPCTVEPCARYGADAPYRTALEVPRGWFADEGVTTGWRITNVPAP